MLQHKLNQAKQKKKQDFNKKKKYVHFQMSPFCPACPFPNSTTCTCARVAHAGTFRQTNISLAGVKLSRVHIYTLKTTTKSTP